MSSVRPTPHRVKHFEAVYGYMRKHKCVWLTIGEDIYKWYRQGRRSL